MSDLINDIDQEVINEIEVVPSLPKGCEVNRACYPEELFELVEQCKLCGRCV